MANTNRQANLLLLLAAAIWGFAFVAQRVGMRHLGPLTFNAIRFALGALVLLPLLRWGPVALRRREKARQPMGRLLRWGLTTGAVLFFGATLQQFGVVYTTAGKAGFITGLYVLFVPLLGLFIGQRYGASVWFSALLAAVGLYLLSAKGVAGIALGDGLVLLSALFWATHVLLIGRLVGQLAVLPLAVTQFTCCSVLSLLGALFFEEIAWTSIRSAAVPLAYAGFLSVGVAYTLQVVAQRRARPAHAAIILSFESVFAALGGWLVLHENFSLRGLIGCALMFAGVLLAQISSERSAEHQRP